VRWPISDRSLNFWVSDLEKFESVSGEEAEPILALSRSVRPSKRIDQLGLRGHPISQLDLPFLETKA
jgi:hypothetical protein